MLPHFRCNLIVALLLAAMASGLAAQTTPASSASSAPFVLEGLGKGLIALDGPWQFRVGDNPAWAAPGFDDSHWQQLSTDKAWDQQGHGSYDGFAWYRRSIVIPPSLSSTMDLGLFIPSVGNACEVFWNGALVGHIGTMPPHQSWYADSSVAVPLGPVKTGVLAIRVWRAPFLSIGWNDSGGLRAPPLVGLRGEIAAHVAALRNDSFRFDVTYLILLPLYSLAVLLGVLAWLTVRGKAAYLWMACFSLSMVVMLLANIPFGWRLSEPLLLAINRAGIGVRDISLWYMLIWLLDLRHVKTLRRITNIVSVIMLVIIALYVFLLMVAWPSSLAHWAQTAEGFLAALYAVPGFLSLVIVGVALARGKRLDTSRWLLAVATVFTQLLVVARNVSIVGLRFTHSTMIDRLLTPIAVIDGIAIHQHTVTDTLVLATLIYAFYRDSVESRRRHTQLEQEFTNARELQQLLIPETLPALPGYALTSAYKPALEVGGDFFQIVPLSGSSTLIILGDVSGKGLKAAMTVSLIVGATRVLTELNSSPAEILAGLNRRLHGRLQGGFTTCIALRIDGDGECILASAGHPAPFLNGREIDLPGALPLGLVAEATFEETSFHLNESDHLILFTDGLLEARSAAGDLYGFDRLKTLFATKPSAAEATEAAVTFGQDDDITVLALTRLVAQSESSALKNSPALTPA